MEDYLSIKEVACKMGVHENTIRRMIKSNRLTAIRLSSSENGRWRIPKSAINMMSAFDLQKVIENSIKKIDDENKNICL